MTQGAADAVEAAEDDGSRQPLPEVFAELVDDCQDWINAEVAVYRAEARRRLIIAGVGLGLMLLSATLLAGTLVALLVGLVFALSPLIGAGWATTLVTAVALAIASVAAQAGRLQLRKLTQGVKTGEGTPRIADSDRDT